MLPSRAEPRRASDGLQPRLTLSVRVCRDKPARCERVHVSASEGLASHAGPEACACCGTGVREALPGERAGRVWSPAIGQGLGADALRTRGRPQWVHRYGKGSPHLAGSKPPRRQGNIGCGTREALPLPGAIAPRPARRTSQGTAVLHGGRASDRSRVPTQRQHTIGGGQGGRRTWREGRWPRARRPSKPGAGPRAGAPCTVRSTGDDRQRGGTTRSR